MEKVIVFLNEERRGSVVCQKCGNLKQIDFKERKSPRSGIAKCKCGNTFSVFFEKRKYYRKQINLTGICFTSGDPTGFSVKLVDISQSGISFLKLAGKPLQPGEIIKLAFQLDDASVNCAASVCTIQDQRVGAKFKSMDAHSMKIIRFFLLP